MGLTQRSNLAPGYGEKRELNGLSCNIPISIELADGRQLDGKVIDLTRDGLAITGLGAQTFPERFNLNGLHDGGSLEASLMWVQGDVLGVSLDDCWNKLVWLETGFQDLVKALRPIEDD